jgi:hypothetical protein
MSNSTARQTFREVVALVAEKAKAKLPTAVNGRIESAVKLVLMHDVMPQPDGSILVGSSRDPLHSYLLVGTACECQDFTRGQAPDGWCQHRLAAGIHKRVRELLPPEPAPAVPDILEPWPDNDAEEPAPATAPPAVPQPAPDSDRNRTYMPLPEAPASCNVYLTISGHKVQVTLRDGDEQRMLARLQTLLDTYPAPAPQASSPPQGEGWCAVHNAQMRLNRGKDGKSDWYSHKTDQGWCKGKGR